MSFVAGHFGEWLQGRLGPEGPLALVTLACPDRGVRVTRERAAGPFALTGDAVLPEPLVRALLQRIGRDAEGAWDLRAAFPVGGGAGMSTAALVAIAREAGVPEGLAEACLAVEGATDPLMLPAPDAVLWAPRQARVLDNVPPPPRAEVVGGFFGPPLRTDPADLAFPDVADLVAAWRGAPGLAEAAGIASESARRCTALRGPSGDPTEALAAALGALGYARAHTGSARALIFTPGAVPVGLFEPMAEAGLTGLCHFTTGGRG